MKIINDFIASFKQVTNMLAHIWAGQWVTIIIILVNHSYYALITGLIIGVLMEIKQYFFDDNKELKLGDRIADVLQI